MLYLEKDEKSLQAQRELWVDVGKQGLLLELKGLLGQESVKIN